MFETAELGRSIDKTTYKAQLPELRAELLQKQFALSQTNTPIAIIISGIDAAGRGEVVNALNEWLDPRGLMTISLDSLTEEDTERPYYWRFWRQLPARGRMSIFFGGWYVNPMLGAVHEELDAAAFKEALMQIRRFETLLAHDGALILKFWLHISQEEQYKRLKKFEKDPHSKRRVSEQDWQHAERYEKFTEIAEQVIRHTDFSYAPWLLVEASDARYRDLTVAQTLLDSLRKLLAVEQATTDDANVAAEVIPALAAHASPVSQPADTIETPIPLTILDTLDLTQTLPDKAYRAGLKTYQGQLNRLSWAAHQQKVSTVVVFEGWDAGGKGGAIRRMTQAMDARLYQVISTAAPTDEEQAHHYLWRFWRHIPRAGRFTIYDRSWYGRVLVERVEGYAKETEWKRAYLEINDFEEQLAQHGTVVIKFWLHIDLDEQLARFKEREKTPYKQHKLTDEDWRNREQWQTYCLAVNDMVARTSTHYAPWTLVAGNDKPFARIQVLQTVCERLEAVL